MAKHGRLKPIGDYLYDKGEVIEQMFSSIPIVEIRNMVPIGLQGMPLHELKAECLIELLGMSDREIVNVLNGKKESTVSSSDSDHEGGFVISDEEKIISDKKIKKEKKEKLKNVKSERPLYRKDDDRKIAEPSTSKRKQKSKEMVEDVSKRKKKKDDTLVGLGSAANITKKKKSDKKKDLAKERVEDDVVVIDDDSDKEEKSEQKTLLDLLELEMRARAIRSLLKKEEEAQAKKILSEYKDEPDDLITIENEPPHIELLSDSDFEESSDVTGDTSNNIVLSDQIVGPLLKCTEQTCASPSHPNDDSIVSTHGTVSPLPKITNAHIVENTAVIDNTRQKCDSSELSQSVSPKSCRENDKTCVPGSSIDHQGSLRTDCTDDEVSVRSIESTDNASEGSSVVKISSFAAEGNTDGLEHSNEEAGDEHAKNNLTLGQTNVSNETDHFLVFEEPSVVPSIDGSLNDSLIEESSHETLVNLTSTSKSVFQVSPPDISHSIPTLTESRALSNVKAVNNHHKPEQNNKALSPSTSLDITNSNRNGENTRIEVECSCEDSGISINSPSIMPIRHDRCETQAPLSDGCVQCDGVAQVEQLTGNVPKNDSSMKSSPSLSPQPQFEVESEVGATTATGEALVSGLAVIEKAILEDFTCMRVEDEFPSDDTYPIVAESHSEVGLSCVSSKQTERSIGPEKQDELSEWATSPTPPGRNVEENKKYQQETVTSPDNADSNSKIDQPTLVTHASEDDGNALAELTFSNSNCHSSDEIVKSCELGIVRKNDFVAKDNVASKTVSDSVSPEVVGSCGVGQATSLKCSVVCSLEPPAEVVELDKDSIFGRVVIPSASLAYDNDEIIDITGGEQLQDSEVIYVSEERVDSVSLDDSDNELSGKAESILEQMNSIFNDLADYVGAAENPTSGVSDSDITAVPEGEEMQSHDDADSVSDDSIEIIDGSETVCSSESEQDASSSEDCILVSQSRDPHSDDCMILPEPELSKYGESTGVNELEDPDCAIVSGDGDSTPCLLSKSMSDFTPSVKSSDLSVAFPLSSDKNDGTVVTIIIEDDEGEEAEVHLLTKEVPPEILNLNAGDKIESNWTTRWLESDNVKKVVKTSKILANVRKQMKIKLKKPEAPTLSEPKPPEEKCVPTLIGSVEEYHRLVEEGVIESKMTRNEGNFENVRHPMKDVDPEQTEVSDIGPRDCKDLVEVREDSEKSLCKTESITPEGKLQSLEREKNLSLLEKSSKREKPENRLFLPVNSSTYMSASNKPFKPTTPSTVNTEEKYEYTIDNSDQEEGEITDSPCEKVVHHIEVEGPKVTSNLNNAGNIDELAHCEGHPESKDVLKHEDDIEEGEIVDDEEGELTDSDAGSSNPGKPGQPEQVPCLKITNRLDKNSNSQPTSRLLQQNPVRPVKQQPTKRFVKQTVNKTPDRNSAAKRFILRNLQLGKKISSNPRNRKKRKKGKGKGKGLGHSSNVVVKNTEHTHVNEGVRQSNIQTNGSLALIASTAHHVASVQQLQLPTGLPQPGTVAPPALTPSVASSGTTQMYDSSYYSWAYSQGLISSSNGNYGYGAPEPTPDPNIYKQWEEYYRKLMEACKAGAEHVSMFSAPTTARPNGYTWVFDHSTSSGQPVLEQGCADSTTGPITRVPPSDLSTGDASEIVPVKTFVMNDRDGSENWQYRFGLKGLLKEHFVADPAASTLGDDNKK